MGFTPTLSGVPGSKDGITQARVTGAVTDTSGATATNIVDVVVAGTNGSWISSVDVTAEGNSTDGAIYFFTFDGTNRRPYGNHLPVNARTVSDTVMPWSGTWIPPNAPLRIPNGWKLQAGTRKGEAFTLTAKGGDN